MVMWRTCCWCAVGVVLCLGLQVRAEEPAGDRRSALICRAIPNLLAGIHSENAGLQESAAFLLGEFRCCESVNCLMAVLKGSGRERAREVAALALCRIGDPRGLFAVKRAVAFDASPRVRARCAWFYNQYVREGTFSFLPSEIGPRPIAQR